MLTPEKRIISDVRWLRPKNRGQYVELIEITFRDRGNDWSEREQAEFCREIGIFVDWRKCPTPCLRRILNRLEHYRMILFAD